MMKFEDGPAAGQVLTMRRAPILLRVTESGGKFDCLNETADTARPGEKLFAYILTARPGTVHLCMRPRRAGGMFFTGSYRMLPDQPDDGTMRSNELWAAWCDANREKLLPAWAREAVQ